MHSFGQPHHSFNEKLNPVLPKLPAQKPHINARYKSGVNVLLSIRAADGLKVSNRITGSMSKAGIPITLDLATAIINSAEVDELFYQLAMKLKESQSCIFKKGSVLREQPHPFDKGNLWVAVVKNDCQITLPDEIMFDQEAFCPNPCCDEQGQIELKDDQYYCPKCNLTYKWMRKEDYKD